VTISGGGGNDMLVLSGDGVAETVTLRPGSAELTAAGFGVTASGMESIQFQGTAADRAWLYDSAGNDALVATPQWARLSGDGFVNYVAGVGSVVAVSQAGGTDLAQLYDSAGNDSLQAGPTSATLRGVGFANEARGFSQVIVLATSGGYDTAVLNDSSGADQLEASPAYAWLHGTGYSIRIQGFDDITVNATSGSGDFAHLIGSNYDDVLGVWWNNRNLFAGGTAIHTYNFQRVQFDGNGGYDTIDYYSSGKGLLYGRSNYGSLIDQVFETQFNGVESVLAHVRSTHRLKTDMAALEYAFQKYSWK